MIPNTQVLEGAVQQNSVALDPVTPLELLYKNIEVEAEVEIEDQENTKCCGRKGTKKITRTILKPCSGKFRPGTFTAIVGPSGCGKTTMLNLLSGRLITNNLSLYGTLSINGEETDNVGQHKDHIGYVMQEDLMLATFTPTETFQFIADMRLPNKTKEEKVQLVNNMIKSLGLAKCKDTYVGNNLIRGISGGQKKRTSIGIELLINPSIIFLDQPTTGLDSTTALHLIRLLNNLAKTGRTIISTIHQPSSEIFLEFEKLMLMVDGNVVYNGGARDSIEYFKGLEMEVPKHSNPLDHYMKIMNKEGIALQYMEKGQDYEDEQVAKQFEQKVLFLVSNYKKKEKKVNHQFSDKLVERDEERLNWCGQGWNLFKRSMYNQLRDPMNIMAKIIQSIFFAVVTIILYEKKGATFNSYDQNLKGVVFFLVMNITFGSIFGSVNAFNSERPIFIRERLSNTYDTVPYFVGRTLSTLPGIIIVPVLFITICYFAVNLNNSAGVYFLTILTGCLLAWMATAYGLFLSALIPDAVVVMALVPVLIIPLLLVGGFFTPLSNVHDFFRVFQYISPFKYGFQSLIQEQYINGAGFTGYPMNQFPVNPATGNPDPNYILRTDQYNFQEPLWLSLVLLGAIGLVIKMAALIALKVLSSPKKINLSPPKHHLSDEQIPALQSHDNLFNGQTVNGNSNNGRGKISVINIKGADPLTA